MSAFDEPGAVLAGIDEFAAAVERVRARGVLAVKVEIGLDGDDGETALLVGDTPAMAAADEALVREVLASRGLDFDQEITQPLAAFRDRLRAIATAVKWNPSTTQH